MVATEVDRPFPHRFPFRPSFSFLAADLWLYEPGACFLKGPATFRAWRQILNSKPVEKLHSS